MKNEYNDLYSLLCFYLGTENISAPAGTLQDKADNSITDQELLIQFKKVEKLSSEKKKLIKEFLDAFLLKSSLEKQLAS